MNKKVIREWKKVFEADLGYIAYELKDHVTQPAVIIVNGPMGAGKTTFTKKFVSENDKNSQTLSPSYSVLSETHNILHGDFYRIEEQEEILHLELSLYLEDKQYFFVEWGEKYLRTLSREVPEDYSFYNLNIEINSGADKSADDKPASRNFSLEELSEID